MATDKIQAAKEYATQLMGIGDYSEKWNHADKYMWNALEKAHRLGAIWQEQQAWVRVEDGLPEEGQVVDTCNGKSKSVRTAILHTRHGEGKFYRHFDMVDGDRVPSVYYTDITHWRHRPSPPGSTPIESKEGKYRAALEKIGGLFEKHPTEQHDEFIAFARALREIENICTEALKP